MPANIDPIYTKAPDIQWITGITAANNTADITSGTSYLIFTADATNGGFVREVRITPNPANNTAATVARLWLNNGSTIATLANSVKLTEVGIPATTASATAAVPDFAIPLNMALPLGYKLYLTIGTAPGGSGAFAAAAIGGKY